MTRYRDKHPDEGSVIEFKTEDGSMGYIVITNDGRIGTFKNVQLAYKFAREKKVDDIDRLLNLLEAVADSVDNMSDEEVQAELEEEDISKRGFGQR